MDTTANPPTVPVPVLTDRGWPAMRAVLRVPNFRWVLASMLTGSMAGWMSRVAQDWLLLELTGNVTMVGLAVTAQFLPILLFGLWGGVLSDRFARLNVLRIAQATTTLGFCAIAALALAGAVQAWHIYLVAVVTGLATVAEAPARSSLVTQIVPPHRIQTAVSVNAMTFHGAGLVGPAVSGVLIATWSAGWALVIAAALAVVSFSVLWCVRRDQLHPAARAEKGSGVRDAVAYAGRKPPIRWSLVLLAFVATFGMTHTVLYAAAATPAGFDSGPTGYGLYMAAGALGAVTGAVISTRRRRIGLRGVVGAATAFGVAMLLAAAAPVQAWFVVAVVVLSVARILFGTGAESLVQLSSRPSIRGRMAGLYFVILTGGQTGGAVLVGWVAQRHGIHAAYLVAGGVPLVATLVVGALVAWTHDWRVRFDLRRPRRFIRLEKRIVEL